MGTISKALELLNFFSRSRREIGLNEFARLVGRDKATVHRHLLELEQNGFVEQHPKTRAYRLGPAILRLAGVREATHPVRSALRPIVEQMAAEAGELCHVSLLQGDMLSPIFQTDPMLHGTQVHFEEAEMLPLHATSSGHVVLAFSAPDFVENILSRPLTAYTDQTITDPEKLSAILRKVRAQGYCIVEQSFDIEVSSLAFPIFGPEGNVIGAVAIALPHQRATKEKIFEIISILKSGMQRITAAVGGEISPQYATLPHRVDAQPHQRTTLNET